MEVTHELIISGIARRVIDNIADAVEIKKGSISFQPAEPYVGLFSPFVDEAVPEKWEVDSGFINDIVEGDYLKNRRGEIVCEINSILRNDKRCLPTVPMTGEIGTSGTGKKTKQYIATVQVEIMAVSFFGNKWDVEFNENQRNYHHEIDIEEYEGDE